MAVLRPGQVYREVVLKDGRKAVLRAPDWRDLDDSLEFINELVRERAEILRTVSTSERGGRMVRGTVGGDWERHPDCSGRGGRS